MSTSIRQRPSRKVYWPLAIAVTALILFVLAEPAVVALVVWKNVGSRTPARASSDAMASLLARLPNTETSLPTPANPDIALAAAPQTSAASLKDVPPPAPLVLASPVGPDVGSVVENLRSASPTVDQTNAGSSFKRRSDASESDLSRRLVKASHEIDVESEPGTTAKLLEAAPKPASKEPARTPHPALALFDTRTDLQGLPVRGESECTVTPEDARVADKLSKQARTPPVRRNQMPRISDNQDNWDSETGLRLLVQMRQVRDTGGRQELVQSLSEIERPSASVALARRAVFDLSSEVRAAAVKELKERPRAEYRQVLLDALRYPWAPVADHAAEALVALDDRAAASSLSALLDLPDPQAPVKGTEVGWKVPELVRVNHLANCVLCHAPSSSKEDLVRGSVPQRDKPLPWGNGYGSVEGSFVRADVTYLRQDFSVMQTVDEPGKWPRQQRFDYFVRWRPLTPDEVVRQITSKPTQPKTDTYPQRDAVQWALRELSSEP